MKDRKRLQSWLWKVGLLATFAVAMVLPTGVQGKGDNDRDRDRDKDDDDDGFVKVLYSGRLFHDSPWTITQGTDPGFCSLVPSDVHSIGEGSERITFQAQKEELGVWKITWTDSVSGTAMALTGQSYVYHYQQRWTYEGPTSNGKRPRPPDTTPQPFFLNALAPNVNAPDAVTDDFFVLQDAATGKVTANSHFQIGWFVFSDPPNPCPLDSFCVGRAQFNTLQQLAGQTTCDPL